MKYEVIVLPAAVSDRDEIIQNLKQLSTQVARKYAQLFAQELRSLAEFRNRCPPPAHDPGLAAKGYRFLVVRNYLVFYTVEGSTVTVRRILDGRRDLTGEW